MRRVLAIGLLCAATASDAAEPPPLLCGGAEPFWNLTIEDDRAAFSTPERPDAVTFDIRLRTRAEGRDWPRAFTLIGRGDTAVIVLDQRSCSDTVTDRAYPYAGTLLTQRGTEPILLSGCCRPRPAN